MAGITATRSRRDFIALAAAGAAATVAPVSPALATPESVAAAIKALVGDRALQQGRIKLDLPTIAENGLVVPLNFEVESPMTEASYVKAVHFFADGNPLPGLANFHFTPLVPKAAGAVRIRLARTQSIVAVAEMSTGEVYTATREVKVTIGGCGG